MEVRRIRLSGPLAALALAVVIAALPAQAVPPPDTVVVIHDQEPPCLNSYVDPCGGLAATHLVTDGVLAGAYRVRPDLSYEEVLVDHVDVATNPFTLTYHLKPEAEWSDGVPVSADDFLATLDAIQDPANNIFSRTGYDRITSATNVDPKTVRFVFSGAYPAWKRLFPQVMPAHVITGEDFDQLFLTSLPIASGPVEFESWQQGVQLSLVRSDDWWGPHDAYAQRVVFRYIVDTNARFQAMVAHEGTLMAPQPQLQIGDLPSHGIVVEWSPGATMEHLDINLASSTMPLLAQAWFRQALAYALDRDGAADAAYGALSPGITADDSLVYLSQKPDYTPHFDGYAYSPGAVAQIMLGHGCVVGADGIWSCGGTRASIRFTTTTGNAVKALVQSRFVTEAKAAGIELVPDNSTTGDLFGRRLPTGDFDIVMFSWVLSGDPLEMAGRYGCGGSSNYIGYCSTQVTALLQAADSELSEAARAVLVNQADAIMAGDVPSLPLYQRPSFVAYWPELEGVVDNVGPQWFVWNMEDWAIPSVQVQDPNPNPNPPIPPDPIPGVNAGPDTSADTSTLALPLLAEAASSPANPRIRRT